VPCDRGGGAGKQTLRSGALKDARFFGVGCGTDDRLPVEGVVELEDHGSLCAPREAGAYGAAAREFERATEQDSSFALAHARIERTLAWSGGEEQARALRRACELSDRLPLRDRRLVRARCRGKLEQRELAVVDTLRRMTADYPQDPQVWHNLGEALFHGWAGSTRRRTAPRRPWPPTDGSSTPGTTPTPNCNAESPRPGSD
jgi:hypothetical protein